MLEPDSGSGKKIYKEVLTLARKSQDLIRDTEYNGDQQDSDKYSKRDILDPDEKENDDTDKYGNVHKAGSAASVES